MDRLKTSISEKSAKFSLPERPRFSLPDKSKFHLPERPKFNFPDRSKFTIKKPNIRLPGALARAKRPPSLREQQQQHSTESTAGSKRNIFDFATYPRIFDKKSKKLDEYATSSPKDSRAQSAESATLPRERKGKFFGARWTRPFGDSDDIQDQERAETAASDGSPAWQQTSMEEAAERRLSARTEEEIMAAAHAIPWEDVRKREQRYDEEEIQYMDYEQESSQEMSDQRPPPPRRSHKGSRRQKESYEREEAMEVETEAARETKKTVGRDEMDDRNADDATRKDWTRADQRMDEFRPIPKSRSLDGNMPVLQHGGYDGTFMAVDPRRFVLPFKMASEEEEEERKRELEEDEEEREPSSARSDREQQQSSGSSCDRRRRGIIEEIDSDEFFLRESGISQDDMNYLTNEIRDALRSTIVITVLQDDELSSVPPQRPTRTRSLRRPKEESNEIVAPVRPKRKREAAATRSSREASIVIEEVFRERTRSDSRSDSRHRVVYQTEGGDQRQASLEREPLDDIVVVKPARRKSRSSLRSQSQPPMETSIVIASTLATTKPADSSSTPFLSAPPDVPLRKKRSHPRTVVVDRTNDADVTPICNGHRDWETETALSKNLATPGSSRQSLTKQLVVEDDVVMVSASHGDIEKLDAQLRQKIFAPEPPAPPVPPKRRSRSRTTSIVADEDRTSHGAESLPEIGYIEDDIPRDETSSARELAGYAIVEKRERPPRPPPPRRRRKFATTPRPTAPKRPQRAYSTLGPATRSRPDTGMSGTIASETIIGATLLTSVDATPYIGIGDSDGEEHSKDTFRRGEVLDKIQGRPLPAPPRPPRTRKEHAIIERPRTPFEFAMAEITTATQTDPLPDDMVIEEEITQAKLIMMPSRSGSQVTVSMERVSSPSRTGTPPVPPLPMSQFLQKEEEEEQELEDEDVRMAYDTVSLTSPSPTRETDLQDRHMSAPHLEEREVAEEESRSRPIRSALLSDEPLRISSLEVGDLKVDRLSVSQIEAHKIVASEVDAMVIATSELRGGSSMEGRSLSPAIIKELMAIRSHLETMATSQTRETYSKSEEESASCGISDIPTSDGDGRAVRERQPSREHSQEAAEHERVESVPAPTEDEKPETDEDQKVVKTNVLDVRDSREVSPHTLTVAQAKESSPPSQTLAIDQLETEDKCEPVATHLLTVTAQDTQDKSLQILDSEHLTLSVQTTSDSHDEFRASFPPSSDVPTTRPSESRVSPERLGESPSSSVQTTTSESTATESTATSTTATACLHGSKDDVSDNAEQIPRKSRSRSSSPGKGIMRQTASPVRSLPPVISVTPDTPDTTAGRGISIMDAQPQRAVISYSSDTEDSGAPEDAQSQRADISHSSDTGRPLRERQRESSQSPASSFPLSTTHFIAFPASEIPAQFFSLNEMTLTNQRIDPEPGIVDTTQQLLRALRSAGIKAMRHFVGYLASTINANDTTREKVREVELAICALLLLIAGLLIYYFSSSRTVTHHHHWDYFNPPQ